MIAQTTTGTRMMRPNVMRFGMLKLQAPALHDAGATRSSAPRNSAEYSGGPAMAPTGTITDIRKRPMSKTGATLCAAGVDIDAGNRMVELIKPLVRRRLRGPAPTPRSAASAAFSISKRAGFTDPILVAATDGVGTKVKIAIETGRHDTIGIDLVAMSVNDLVVQGAEPLFFLDYFACGKLDPEIGAAVVTGIAAGLPRSRLRADRRRDGGDAGIYQRRRL